LNERSVRRTAGTIVRWLWQRGHNLQPARLWPTAAAAASWVSASAICCWH